MSIYNVRQKQYHIIVVGFYGGLSICGLFVVL